jgi:hypothetical protein
LIQLNFKAKFISICKCSGSRSCICIIKCRFLLERLLIMNLVSKTQEVYTVYTVASIYMNASNDLYLHVANFDSKSMSSSRCFGLKFNNFTKDSSSCRFDWFAKRFPRHNCSPPKTIYYILCSCVSYMR